MKELFLARLALVFSGLSLFAFLGLSTLSSTSLAQNPADPNSHLSGAGQLFSIKIVPGQKETSFFVIGKKSASLKFENLQIKASLFIGDQEKTLKLIRRNDHFVTDTPLIGDRVDFQLQSDEKVGNETYGTEELRVKLKP